MGTCMGNRRSSHSSLEEDSHKTPHTGNASSNKPRQENKRGSNPKSSQNEPLLPPPDPGPPPKESPILSSPDKQTPDKPPPVKKRSHLPDLGKYSEEMRNLLLGNLSGSKLRKKPRMVRIYVSSVQDDSEAERIALMETVYPKLREYAATQGVELHMVDPHWNIWDPKLDDERTADLRLEEIKQCQRMSTGPNFVTFLNQKYGRLLAPSRILASAYDRLLRKVTNLGEQELLSKTYKLDENAVPRVYILQLSLTSSADKEKICQILRNSWGKEEKELYLASVCQTEIEEAVFSPSSQSDGVIWVHRRFTHISHTDPASSRHLDLGSDGKTDTHSQEQLSQLTKRLATKVNESNFLKFDIPWNASGLDPDGIESHRKYFEDFCTRMHTVLKAVIDKALTESSEGESQQQKIHQRLCTELEQQMEFCQDHIETFRGRTEVLQQLESYLNSNKNSPLVLHGDLGSGKSSLAAMCAKLSRKHMPKCACVMRFIGTSVQSLNLNQIFRSACEQMAYLYGEHISIASGGLERLKQDLPKLLDKVAADLPLVMILDGIDQLHPEVVQSFDWLPKVLPAHVKMIITCKSVNCKMFSNLKSYLGDCAMYIDIPALTIEEINKLRDITMRSKSRTLTRQQHENVKNALTGSPTPLYTQLACYVASTWRSYTTQEEISISRDVMSQIEALLLFLEGRYGKEAVMHTLSYLTIARQGISDSEMNDVLSCDDVVLDKLFKDSSPALRRVPSLLWMSLCLELKVFLVVRTVQGKQLFAWRHPVFAKVVQNRYHSKDVDKQKLHKNLKDYFCGQWAGNRKKPFLTESGIESQADRHVISQPECYQNYANVRKFQELPFQTFFSGEKDFAKQFIWNAQWINLKIKYCDVYDFLEDVDLALKASSSDGDLSFLKHILQLSAYALTCNGSQMFPHMQQRSQIHSTSNRSNHPKITKLLEAASKEKVAKFSLSDGCLRENVESVKEDGKKGELPISGLHRVKGNPAYMVSLSMEKGEIIVWNILTQKVVRTLKNVESPRDLRFIDDHRVVVLCNRELKIFNLDSGQFETKLKGIMNLAMPYFALHDKEHVVALARNRMYVNVINVKSGDIVSMFKAGEDRFMNSLLVSDNGQRCVCGDETQKPSPLLVWDLQQRKLIHDFRIAQHEFVTKMASISTDGHYVVSVITELSDPSRNFVIVYDLISGQLYKKWKPPVNTTCVDISSEGMCVVNGCKDSSILVWDLLSGSQKHKLVGHTHPINKLYLSEQGTHCLTHDDTNQDRSVFLWDLVNGDCLATLTPDLPVSCCQISAEGSCAAVALVGQAEIATIRILDDQGKPKKIEDKGFGDAAKKGTVFDISTQM